MGGERPDARVFKGHSGEVHHVAISADSKLIATAATTGDVLIWDSQTLEIRHRRRDHTAPALVLAFRNKAKELVSVDSSGKVCVLDLDSAQITSHDFHESISAAAASRDGGMLALCAAKADKSTITIWSPDGRSEKPLPVTGQVRSVALTLDGRWAVAVTTTDILFVERDTSKERYYLSSDAGPKQVTLHGVPRLGLHSVALSPDGRTLAASDEGVIVPSEIKLWNIDEQLMWTRVQMKFPYTPREVSDVAFTRDGKYAIVATSPIAVDTKGQAEIDVWDFPVPGEHPRYRLPERSSVRSIAGSPDSLLLASGHDDGRVLIWDLESGKTIQTLTGHSEAIRALFVRSTGQPAVCRRRRWRDSGVGHPLLGTS